jgi:hypothetical protein
LIIAATPRLAQALRKLNDIGWKPLTIVNAVSSSVSATLQPVGLDKVDGVVSAAFFKASACAVSPIWLRMTLFLTTAGFTQIIGTDAYDLRRVLLPLPFQGVEYAERKGDVRGN